MKLLTTILLFFLFNTTYGKVVLPRLFCDNIILQQKSKVNFWGKAAPGEKITILVGWLNKEYLITTPSSGNWNLKIKTIAGSSQEYSIVIKGSNTIVLQKVLLGEVWFSSGQSNMEWTMRRVKEAEKELKEAEYPAIRLFNVIKGKSETPQDEFVQGSKWLPCTPENVKEFSAISYYFARELHLKLKVPIGIITSSWGGTGAECWTPEEKMKNHPVLKNIYNRWIDWDLNRKKDSIAFVEVKKANPKAEDPKSVYMTNRPHRRPSVLYNAMVNPLLNFTFKGVVWYQGTSNVDWAEEYFDQMKALIDGWRSKFNNGTLPFYYMQISAFKYSDSNKAALLRENQVKTLGIPKTAMCATMDIGELKDIHPIYKLPYGLRLANIALANSYNQKDIIFCGPLYKEHKIENDTIEISFKFDQKLAFNGQRLEDIFIAGADKKFVKAEAYIKENELHVFSPLVKKPVSVRYAWNNTEKANLFNGANLPASPFRTDNWENISIE